MSQTLPISEAIALLGSHGLAASAQRVTLLATVLSSHGDHPTADELYRVLSEQFPTLSRATVYNNLSALASAGILEKLDTPDGSRYGPVAEPHVNLVCSVCKSVKDVLVGDTQLAILASRAATAGNFRARGISATITGVCTECQANSPE